MSWLSYMRRVDVRRDPLRLLVRRAWFEVEKRWLRDRLFRLRLARFDGPACLWLRPSDHIERAMFLYGYSEFRVAMLLDRLLAPGMVFFDIGAHIGQFTIMAARRVRPGGRVVAVEPHPDRVARLRNNAGVNHADNVVVIAAAFADESGQEALHEPPGYSDNSGLATLRPTVEAERTRCVEVSTVDREVKRLSLDRLDVMKLDVEGAEAQVVRGGQGSIARWKPFIVTEINDVTSDGSVFSAPVIDALSALGYTFHGISLDSRGAPVLHELPVGVDPSPYREPWNALNLVAIPRERSDSVRTLIRLESL